ncbi:MAG: DUF1080 domain-containing protein [Armatimonadetes bacterium]|nr:DUF1080 domain-containing protein [Armatimonadota bacterium]
MGLAPPAGAVVLFDGKDLAKWTRMDGNPATWKVADGAMTSVGGDIRSQDTFGDAYVHLEWMEPDMPDAQGQARGNSGVALQGRYEVQVLDSFGIDVPGKGDCGAVYAQYAALVNACRPPLEWQTYDIIFRAPRYGADKQLLEHARLTVLQNGIVIQNNVQVTGLNYPPMDADPSTPGPLLLQDHGCPVQYRNVWFVPLPEKGSEEYEGKRAG